jgi:hypothetical protein
MTTVTNLLPTPSCLLADSALVTFSFQGKLQGMKFSEAVGFTRAVEITSSKLSSTSEKVSSVFSQIIVSRCIIYITPSSNGISFRHVQEVNDCVLNTG